MPISWLTMTRTTTHVRIKNKTKRELARVKKAGRFNDFNAVIEAGISCLGIRSNAKPYTMTNSEFGCKRNQK